jgi:hypothetical protein
MCNRLEKLPIAREVIRYYNNKKARSSQDPDNFKDILAEKTQ